MCDKLSQSYESECCSVPIGNVSYCYSLSTTELNKLIKCLSIENVNVSGCFSPFCPDLCSPMAYIVPTEFPHNIPPDKSLLCLNHCYPSEERYRLQRVVSRVLPSAVEHLRNSI